MKKLKIMLWSAIIVVILMILGVWGYAFYHFILNDDLGIFLGGNLGRSSKEIADYEEFKPDREESLTLLLDEHDFFVGEPGEVHVTILCGDEIEGEVSIADEDGTIACTLENDRSGILTASIPITEDEERIGSLTALADGLTSNSESIYVLPKVTDDMVERLQDTAKNLEEFLSQKGYEDPYSQKAFQEIIQYLEQDERVAVVGENNGVILYQTVDHLMGSYGLGRQDGLYYGYSGADETYQNWKENVNVSTDVIESGIPITNDKIYHLYPHDSDVIISGSVPIYEEQERRLADALQLQQHTFGGREALQMILDGSFMDCGFLMFNTHGRLLEQSDESDMLFISLGKVTKENMRELLGEDERELGYQYFWGEMKTNEETGKIIGLDQYRMVYDLIPEGDGKNFSHLIWGSTLYLQSIFRDHMFDNTVVYFAVCFGYADPQVRDLFFSHGASAFMGCTKDFNIGLSAAFFETLVNKLGEKGTTQDYSTLHQAMSAPLTRKADKAAREIIQSCASAMVENNIMRKEDKKKECQETYDVYKEDAESKCVVFCIAPGKKDRVFRGAGNITGYVTTSEGEGIAGAEVELHRWLNHRFEQVEVTATDGDGKYEAEVPRGIYGITARAKIDDKILEGNAVVQFGKDTDEAPTIILGLLELVGTVKDEETGEPIAGATVQWQLDEQTSSVLTDETGKFVIKSPALGEYMLQVFMEGYQDSEKIRVMAEEEATIVLLDDILLKRDLDYYEFIRGTLLPQMGYASTDKAETILKPDNIWSMPNVWDQRSGLLSADIVDLNGDGTEDLLVYYFAETTENYRDGWSVPALYASLYTKDEAGIYLVNTLLLGSFTAINFDELSAGLMEIGGKNYLYVESYSTAYFADGFSKQYTWYSYDGTELRPYWMVGKTDGGTSNIAYSILTYSDAENYTKQVLWAEGDYLSYNPTVLIPPSIAGWDNQDQSLQEGFSMIGIPAPLILPNEDGDGSRLSYWGSGALKKSFQYLCYGDGTYSSRNMHVAVTDETQLKEHVGE